MSYFSRLAKLALRDPFKIPSMLRLKTAKVTGWQQNSSVLDNEIVPPLVIAIRPNYGCNLRCVMCNQWGENGAFIKTPEKLVKRDMTTQDWKNFFDDIAKFKPYVYFTGGEPLMNADIFELISYASSKHIITSMSTNSTFLKDKAKDLINSGLDYLYTSLDAPTPATKDIVRINTKDEDSNSDAVEAIKTVIKLRDSMGKGLPIIQTQTIIVKENQSQLLDMAKFVDQDLKPDVWGLQLCVFTTPELDQATTQMYQDNFNQDQVGWTGFIRDFDGMNFDLIQKQLTQIEQTKWSYKLRMYKPLGMPGFDLKQYFTQPTENSTTDPLTCLNPYVFAQIQPNGDIAFCGSQPDYTIGNVKNAPFMDLWNNQKSVDWRKFLKKQLFPSCKRCFSLHEFSHFKA
ncbi:MAG: MoaA/NifB/PqqE/SkfB family radical SAM enzyme [Candidatus Omnitrophota bacterium]|jgi:MoaA/NifB/PqqE/SkfB family radical SAM enzyme